MERYIERVKSNIQAKASPLKLAETRLAKRSKESCNLPSLTSFLPPQCWQQANQYNIDLMTWQPQSGPTFFMQGKGTITITISNQPS